MCKLIGQYVLKYVSCDMYKCPKEIYTFNIINNFETMLIKVYVEHILLPNYSIINDK